MPGPVFKGETALPPPVITPAVAMCTCCLPGNACALAHLLLTPQEVDTDSIPILQMRKLRSHN